MFNVKFNTPLRVETINRRTDLTNKIRIEAYQSTITSHIKQKKKNSGHTDIRRVGKG